MHQNANGSYIWGVGIMSDSYSLCLYVFLVACNEHILPVKLEDNKCKTKMKKKDQMSINKQDPEEESDSGNNEHSRPRKQL